MALPISWYDLALPLGPKRTKRNLNKDEKMRCDKVRISKTLASLSNVASWTLDDFTWWAQGPQWVPQAWQPAADGQKPQRGFPGNLPPRPARLKPQHRGAIFSWTYSSAVIMEVGGGLGLGYKFPLVEVIRVSCTCKPSGVLCWCQYKCVGTGSTCPSFNYVLNSSLILCRPISIHPQSGFIEI